MSKTFRNALLTRMSSPDAPSWKAVAEGAGVSYEQLKKVKQRDTASTNVDDAVKIAHFFGCTLDEFLGDRLASDRLEIANLYSQLTEEERDLLRDAALGRAARESRGS